METVVRQSHSKATSSKFRQHCAMERAFKSFSGLFLDPSYMPITDYCLNNEWLAGVPSVQ